MIYLPRHFHPKACDFIDACATLTEAQRIIVNDLVKNLINGGLWDLGLAIYPVIGGVADTHKYNLKDPRDLDAAFRIIFFGNITHSATGMVGDGSTGYYDTKLVDNAILAQDNVSMGAYIRTNASIASGYDLVSNQTSAFRLGFNSRGYLTRCHDATGSTLANTDSRGFFLISRIDSAGYQKYKNTTETSIVMASTGMNSTSIIGMKWSTVYNTREQAFIWIGLGISTAQQALLYSIIQAYQTLLGRPV